MLKNTIKGLIVGFIVTTIYALSVVQFAPFRIDVRLFIASLTVFPLWAGIMMVFYGKDKR